MSTMTTLVDLMDEILGLLLEFISEIVVLFDVNLAFLLHLSNLVVILVYLEIVIILSHLQCLPDD